MMLTTTGRRSGRPRSVVIGYLREGDDLIAIGSNGGLPRDPAWIENLRALPQARVQIGERQFAVRADWPDPAERDRLWQLFLATYPVYGRYQQKGDREIPLVRLQPA